MPLPDYDIAIIGLGPAGAVFAAHLDPGISAVALDKKGTDESGFKKPCGGLLAPDAQRALAGLGWTLPKSMLVDPQIFSVRTLDLATGLERHYQRHYMNLDRHRFDSWLAGKIGSGVSVRSGAVCTGVTREGDVYRVEYEQGGVQQCLTARMVVGADGAASRVRGALYPRFKIKTYMCIQQWFSDVHASPFYSCVFDPSVTDCYAWGLTKEQYFIFGGAFAVQGARSSFERLKSGLAAQGFMLDNPIRTEACLTLRPRPLQYCTGRGGALLVGEAAGFISPSSLEGISYAIESGYLLSRAVNSAAQAGRWGDAGRLYRRHTLGLRLKLVLKSLKSIFMYTPLLRKLIMTSGICSLRVVKSK